MERIFYKLIIFILASNKYSDDDEDYSDDDDDENEESSGKVVTKKGYEVSIFFISTKNCRFLKYVFKNRTFWWNPVFLL